MAYLRYRAIVGAVAGRSTQGARDLAGLGVVAGRSAQRHVIGRSGRWPLEQDRALAGEALSLGTNGSPQPYFENLENVSYRRI